MNILKIIFGLLAAFCCLYWLDTCSCKRDAEKKEANEWVAKMEKAIGAGDFTEARTCAANLGHYDGRDSAYEKISRAQIAFLLNNGNLDQAYSIAQEDKCGAIFTELFMPKLSEIHESQGKIKTLQYLTKVEFSCSPDLTDHYIGSYDNNKKYNDEVARYNSLLEQFIVYIDIMNDKIFARQLLKFAKPIVVETPYNKDGSANNVKLSDQPQADIKRKLGL